MPICIRECEDDNPPLTTNQVNLEGEMNSLTPLEAAAPGLIHIFSKPAIYRNALWLPYRRDPKAIEAAVEAAASSSLPEGLGEREENGNHPTGVTLICPAPSVDAVFAHADVVRAVVRL